MRYFRDRRDQSASKYPALKRCPRPRWRYARFGSHKTYGVERHFLNQESRTPFDCQAISHSPSANIIVRSPCQADQPLLCRPMQSPGVGLFVAPEHRPGNPDQLVGASHHGDNGMEARHQLARPPPNEVSRSRTYGGAAGAPWINCFRRCLLPRLLIPITFGFPPVVHCPPTMFESLCFSDRRAHSRCDRDARARNPQQSPRIFVLFRESHELVVA